VFVAGGLGGAGSPTGAPTPGDDGGRDLADVVDDGAPGDDAADEATDDGGSTEYLSREWLRSVVTRLAADEMDGRNEGTEGAAAARTYLLGLLAGCGLTPAGTSGFEQAITGSDGINLLGRVSGSDPARADRLIILGAHYDHLGDCSGAICNGAYDNATAVAGALAVGCTLMESPPPRSVLVALWDSEEPPTFLTDTMGSQFYTLHPTTPLAQTDAALALDLLGEDLWPGFPGHFLLGAELSPEVASAVDAALATVPSGLEAHRFGLHLVEEQPFGHSPWSDYDAFRNLGIPVLFVSDGQNKRYHLSSDETASVDFDRLLAETQLLQTLVTGLASATSNPTFVTDGADYPLDADTIVTVGEDATAAGTGLADSLGLSATSRTAMENDLTAARATQAAIAGGATPTPAQIQSLRAVVQRMMCLAGSSYPEALCTAF
jgi:hypothetical protein